MAGIALAEMQERANFSGGAATAPSVEETFTAAFSRAFSTETWVGLQLLRADETDKLIREFRSVVGRAPELGEGRNINRAADILAFVAEMPEGERRGLPTSAEFEARVNARIRGTRRLADETLARSRGTPKGAAEFLGGMFGFTLDPFVLATLPVGGLAVGASKGIGRAALMTAAREGALGGASGAASALAANPVQARAGIALTSPVEAGLFAALGGAGLGALMGAGAGFFRARKLKGAQREIDQLRAGIEDAESIVSRYTEVADSVGMSSPDARVAFGNAVDDAQRMIEAGFPAGRAEVFSIFTRELTERLNVERVVAAAPELEKAAAREGAELGRAAQKVADDRLGAQEARQDAAVARAGRGQAGAGRTAKIVADEKRAIAQEKVAVENALGAVELVQPGRRGEAVVAQALRAAEDFLPEGFSAKARIEPSDTKGKFDVVLETGEKGASTVAVRLEREAAANAAQRAVANELRPHLLNPRRPTTEAATSAPGAQRAAKEAAELSDEAVAAKQTDTLDAAVRADTEEISGDILGPTLILQDRDKLSIRDLAELGDDALSPFLLRNGEVRATSGDHLGAAQDLGFSTVEEMQAATGAARISVPGPTPRARVIFVQLVEGQRLTQQQAQTIKSVLARSRGTMIYEVVDQKGGVLLTLEGKAAAKQLSEVVQTARRDLFGITDEGREITAKSKLDEIDDKKAAVLKFEECIKTGGAKPRKSVKAGAKRAPKPKKATTRKPKK